MQVVISRVEHSVENGHVHVFGFPLFFNYPLNLTLPFLLIIINSLCGYSSLAD
jgi:hypothetical protein